MENIEVKKGLTGLAQTKKEVNQYNLKGEFIKTWESLGTIERELKVAHSSVSQCCTMKRQTAGGFIWRYNIK